MALAAVLALGGSAATHAAPAFRAAGRDDTAWLQARLDAGGGGVSFVLAGSLPPAAAEAAARALG